MKCSLCNNNIPEDQNITYNFCGTNRAICPECWQTINDLSSHRKNKSESSRMVLTHILKRKDLPQDITTELLHLLHLPEIPKDPVTHETPTQSFYSNTNSNSRDERITLSLKEKGNKTRQKNGDGFLVAGIIFLILAALLFYFSIRPLDKEAASLLNISAVANMQDTVYSAACLIASIICFCCKGLTSYMRK